MFVRGVHRCKGIDMLVTGGEKTYYRKRISRKSLWLLISVDILNERLPKYMIEKLTKLKR